MYMLNNQITSVEVVEVEVVKEPKKVSLRQDFLKGMDCVLGKLDLDGELRERIGLSEDELSKMKEYYLTQINKTKSIDNSTYKPTDKAKLILEVLIAFENEFIAGKTIAENSQGQLKANGVSGSIRSLITHEFVEATETTPKKYKITQKGIDFLG